MMLNKSLFVRNIVRPSVPVSDVGLTSPLESTPSHRVAVEVSGPSSQPGTQDCFGGTPTGHSSLAGNRAGVESTLIGIPPKRHGLLFGLKNRLFRNLKTSVKKLLPTRCRLSSQQKKLIDSLNDRGVPHVIEERRDKLTIRPTVWVPIMDITEESGYDFELEMAPKEANERSTAETLDIEVISVSQESNPVWFITKSFPKE